MRRSAPLLVWFGFSLTALAQTPAPFAPAGALPSKQVKSASVKSFDIDCLTLEKAASWVIENPQAGQTGKAFSIEQEDGKGVLNIPTALYDPARTTVRILLPGDGPANGNVWSKGGANFVSFYCKSSKPAEMTFHLLQRGKTAGTFQTGFSVEPGDWQHVILPVSQFGLKSFANVAGLGIRVASADKDAVVSIKGISVGGMAFTDDSWKSHRLSISINGDWHFAIDPGDLGMKEKWYADGFDDSKWQVLRSGLSWQEQGVSHSGFGWYRQQIFIPKEFAGIPLTLTFSPMPSDDDAWFNGTRIGGFSGEYKYNNWITRSYTVPPSAIRYGENNTIALRIWGGDITFIGDKSGLIKGPLVAELDPYRVKMREPGGTAVAAELFDLSDARQGKPFEIVFPFPPELAKEPGAKLDYRLVDGVGSEIISGKVPLAAGTDGAVQGVVSIDRETAQKIYLRGRFKASLLVEDAAGSAIYSGTRDVDHLTFVKRDEQPLPTLPEKVEDTPYGKLKLVDEIDCSASLFDDPHPYFESGFTHAQDRLPPGSAAEVKVNEILGKKARESEFGWFAYRIGRGKLQATHDLPAPHRIPGGQAEDRPDRDPDRTKLHGRRLEKWRGGRRRLRQLAAQRKMAVV